LGKRATSVQESREGKAYTKKKRARKEIRDRGRGMGRVYMQSKEGSSGRGSYWGGRHFKKSENILQRSLKRMPVKSQKTTEGKAETHEETKIITLKNAT